MSAFDLALPLTYEVHHLSTGISAIVYDAKGCGIDTHLYEEQAAQIVKACNLHDDLIAGLHRVHNALIDPSRPRQAVGEMVAYLLTKAGEL